MKPTNNGGIGWKEKGGVIGAGMGKIQGCVLQIGRIVVGAKGFFRKFNRFATTNLSN